MYQYLFYEVINEHVHVGYFDQQLCHLVQQYLRLLLDNSFLILEKLYIRTQTNLKIIQYIHCIIKHIFNYVTVRTNYLELLSAINHSNVDILVLESTLHVLVQSAFKVTYKKICQRNWFYNIKKLLIKIITLILTIPRHSADSKKI